MARITRPDFSKIPLDQGTHPRQQPKAVSGWMTQRQLQVFVTFARRTAFFESSSAAGGCASMTTSAAD